LDREGGNTVAERIIIKPDERVAIIGKTGSGKTELAKKLLELFPYTVVLDNKGTFGNDKNTKEFVLPGFVLVRNFDSLGEAGKQYNKIVFRPDAELEAHRNEFLEVMDAFYWWIYYRENCIVYTDEATAVCDSSNILPGHNACVKRGRELGIGCWNGTQQPVNVHNTLFSEAEHFFVFRTQLQSHRDKLSGFMGDNVKKKIPPKYHFWYFNPETMDEAEMYKPIPL
jgi:ABC-type dipeptide/oligopeptide/nickel transport system ATPase component